MQNNNHIFKKRIGIMGGTFNPIHNGHLELANKAYQALFLDKVLFIPSGTSYMKNNVLEAEKRVEMVKRAISPYPYFELSLIEVERSGNTYTFETLTALSEQNKDVQYYFIMGADSLFQIEQWKNPKQIFSLATLVCTVRDDFDLAAIKQKGEELKAIGAEIIYLDMPLINISSSEIRMRVKQQLLYTDLVPEAVAQYIRQERLYLYEKDKKVFKKASD